MNSPESLKNAGPIVWQRPDLAQVTGKTVRIQPARELQRQLLRATEAGSNVKRQGQDPQPRISLSRSRHGGRMLTDPWA